MATAVSARVLARPLETPKPVHRKTVYVRWAKHENCCAKVAFAAAIALAMGVVFMTTANVMRGKTSPYMDKVDVITYTTGIALTACLLFYSFVCSQRASVKNQIVAIRN